MGSLLAHTGAIVCIAITCTCILEAYCLSIRGIRVLTYVLHTSQHCRDCSEPPAYLPGLPLVISAIFGLLLVVGALWLNFGLSPNVDSLLFFVQVGGWSEDP